MKISNLEKDDYIPPNSLTSIVAFSIRGSGTMSPLAAVIVAPVPAVVEVADPEGANR